MRLLIISHTPHYLRDGTVVGWGATVREIDELAKLFDSIVHIAPLYPDPAPNSALPYQSAAIRFTPVAPAGGERWREKLRIPLRYPQYTRAILQARRAADVVHVRAPANISLLALLLLGVLKKPKLRWVKYAGDWNRGKGEPLTYRLQRWWLARGLHRGLVTVNGSCRNQPAHVSSFLNPCLTQTELAEGAVASIQKRMESPLNLLFVGRIESAKGADVCLEVVAGLDRGGVPVSLDLIGEGDDIGRFRGLATELGISSQVRFHGGLPRGQLGNFYRPAHLILLPSESEGWPKVLSEAMAYGVVPIASAVGCIPEYLGRFSSGSVVPGRNPSSFREAVEAYLRTPALWQAHSRNAVAAAPRFSYAFYLDEVAKLLRLPTATGRVPC